jgi:hypothetical protein
MRKPLLFLFAAVPLFLAAQRTTFPLNLSLFNEATAIPFTRIVTVPVHPGIQAGTEWDYKVKSHSRLFQTANLLYYYHQHLNHAIGATTEIGYELRTKPGLSFTGQFGLGYLHTFSVGEEHTFVDGTYVQRADRGNPRLMPSLSLDVGYYLNKESVTSPKLFLRYQSWIEYPYSPGFIPVMTHINLHLGVRLMLQKGGTKHEG